MQAGMIGLGRMGASMTRRLMQRGHECVVFDRVPEAVDRLRLDGAVATHQLSELVSRLARPRVLWMMVPSGGIDTTLAELVPLLAIGDIVVDGGNSYYQDSIRRGRSLQQHGLHYVDVGTSGGIAGAERGYCLMVGGEPAVFEHLRPLFASLAPGVGAAARTPGRVQQTTPAEEGFLHCGALGAGHFVKMVHNGIEYALMAAYAEGMNILRGANTGLHPAAADAETAPLQHPEFYTYDLPLGEIAEVWRRGSVISSWLLDLTAQALLDDPELERFAGRVADSGEGRWTIQSAIDEGIPAPVLSAALFDRFASRDAALYSHRLLSAMRHAFGGHAEPVPIQR